MSMENHDVSFPDIDIYLCYLNLSFLLQKLIVRWVRIYSIINVAFQNIMMLRT